MQYSIMRRLVQESKKIGVNDIERAISLSRLDHT
jgi:hypothetical protein